MNPDVKAKWLARLRDPKSRKATGHLSNGHGSYCCLGHLCEIARAEGVVTRIRAANGNTLYGAPGDERHNIFLPEEVVRPWR